MNLDTKVIKIINEHLCCPIEDIKLTSLLDRDLGADSLDLVELIISLEEHFNVSLPDDEVDQLYLQGTGTVQALIDLLKQKGAK